MKPFSLRLLSFLLLVSCADHEFDNTSTKESLRMATALCQKTGVEMQWFSILLQRAETDASLRGDIYAVSVDGHIIFAHQPMIMSCFGCVLYDCGGKKLDMANVDHAKVVAGMREENRIYSAY